jgi:hypothetical protein
MSARWLALAGFLATLATAPAALAKELPLPLAWHFSRNYPLDDDYAAGLTDIGTHGGKTCGYIKSGLHTPKGWGDVNQAFKADRFRGKRLRLTGWLKPIDVHGRGLMWVRIDGKGGKILAMDAMFDRAVSGSSGWKRHAIVLDVDPAAEVINFGVELNGTGALCFDDLKFDVVGKSVGTTLNVPREGPANLNLEKN